MRNLRQVIAGLVVCSIALPLYILAAATPHKTYLSEVRTPQQAMAEPQKIIDHDLGFINAVNLNGTFYVAYQLRPEGQVIVAVHSATGLVPLPDPNVSKVLSDALGLNKQAEQPQMELPGPKQGSVSMVPDGRFLRIYFTGRPVGKPTDPFYGWYWIIDPTASD